MHAEHLRHIAEAVLTDFKTNGIIKGWNKLIGAVEQQISQPSPDSAKSVIEARDEIKANLSNSLAAKMPASWRLILSEISSEYYEMVRLVQLVDGIFEENQLALNDRLEELKEIQRLLVGDEEAFRKIVEAFTWMGIESADLPLGEGEVTAFIPRDLFNNDLDGLQEELKDLDFFLKTCTEVVTQRSADSAQIRFFSTTDPVFWIAATPPVAFFVAKLVNQILDAYAKVLAIRKTKMEISKMVTDAGFVASFDAQAANVVANVTKEIASLARTKYLEKHKDKGRANELENALVKAVETLAAKIDHGYRLEARVELSATPVDGATQDGVSPRPKVEGLTDKDIEELKRLSEKMRHFERVGEPILSLPRPRIEKRKGASKAAGRKK